MSFIENFAENLAEELGDALATTADAVGGVARNAARIGGGAAADAATVAADKAIAIADVVSDGVGGAAGDEPVVERRHVELAPGAVVFGDHRPARIDERPGAPERVETGGGVGRDAYFFRRLDHSAGVVESGEAPVVAGRLEHSE